MVVVTGGVTNLCGGEVEVAELPGPDDDCLAGVAAGCEPLQLVLQLAGHHVEIVRPAAAHHLDNLIYSSLHQCCGSVTFWCGSESRSVDP